MAVDGATLRTTIITGSNNKLDIHEVAGQGSLSDVKTYLKAGGLIDKRDADRWTPLMMAAREGHLEVAKILLRSGASLEARDGDKWTAMHVAAANGHPQCCQLLLDRGANPRVVDENKRTPLHWATRYGYAAVVELLLKRGADANCKDADGKKPGDVVGMDLSEDSREIIHALFLEHGTRTRTSRQRRGSCPNIAPAVPIATLDTTSPAAAAAAVTSEIITVTYGGHKNLAGQVDVPLPSLTTPNRGAADGGGATYGSILGARSGGNDATNGAEGSVEEGVGVIAAAAGDVIAAAAGDGGDGAGGSSPAAKRRAQHRRGSYSAAAHIRDHLPTHQHRDENSSSTTNSATVPLLAAASAAGRESQAASNLPRESPQACETEGSDSRARVDRRDEGDEVDTLRRALKAAEDRALEAETLRAEEERSRLREEARASALEERVAELEKLLAQHN